MNFLSKDTVAPFVVGFDGDLYVDPTLLGGVTGEEYNNRLLCRTIFERNPETKIKAIKENDVVTIYVDVRSFETFALDVLDAIFVPFLMITIGSLNVRGCHVR